MLFFYIFCASLTLIDGFKFGYKLMRFIDIQHENHAQMFKIFDTSLKTESLAHSFIEQKNNILLDKLLNPLDGNVTAVALNYVNFCDESFDNFLTNIMSLSKNELERQKLGKIRYEVNTARRYKLIEADKILRKILSAGGLKQMEAKLAYFLRRSEIDMAFMVILQLNIEDALNASVTTAVQVMKHLETLINEHQDSLVSPPVRLLRMLLRADDATIRKQMLRQKLLYKLENGEFLSSGEIEALVRTLSPVNDKGRSLAEIIEAKNELLNKQSAEVVSDSAEESVDMLPTPSAQCENILVDAVKSWGKPDVSFCDLEDTITDVLSQVLSIFSQLCALSLFFYLDDWNRRSKLESS